MSKKHNAISYAIMPCRCYKLWAISKEGDRVTADWRWKTDSGQRWHLKWFLVWAKRENDISDSWVSMKGNSEARKSRRSLGDGGWFQLADIIDKAWKRGEGWVTGLAYRVWISSGSQEIKQPIFLNWEATVHHGSLRIVCLTRTDRINDEGSPWHSLGGATIPV